MFWKNSPNSRKSRENEDFPRPEGPSRETEGNNAAPKTAQLPRKRHLAFSKSKKNREIAAFNREEQFAAPRKSRGTYIPFVVQALAGFPPQFSA
jgi:hypothetical protein